MDYDLFYHVLSLYIDEKNWEMDCDSVFLMNDLSIWNLGFYKSIQSDKNEKQTWSDSGCYFGNGGIWNDFCLFYP